MELIKVSNLQNISVNDVSRMRVIIPNKLEMFHFRLNGWFRFEALKTKKSNRQIYLNTIVRNIRSLK